MTLPSRMNVIISAFIIALVFCANAQARPSDLINLLKVNAWLEMEPAGSGIGETSDEIPDLLQSGINHSIQGRPAEATMDIERSLMLAQKHFGLEHRITAAISSVYGGHLLFVGEAAKAEEYLHNALAFVDTNGERFTFEIAELNGLMAVSLDIQGCHQEAKIYHDKALHQAFMRSTDKSRSLLPGIHNNLAINQEALGDLDEAKFMSVAAVGLAESNLGKNHDHTMIFRMGLDNLKIVNKVPGLTGKLRPRISLISNRSGLAIIRQKSVEFVTWAHKFTSQGRYLEAEPAYRQAIMYSQLDPASGVAQKAKLYAGMGVTLFNLKEYERSIQWLRKSLIFYANSDLDVRAAEADVMMDMAILYVADGKDKDATWSLQQAIDLAIDVHGPDHVKTRSFLSMQKYLSNTDAGASPPVLKKIQNKIQTSYAHATELFGQGDHQKAEDIIQDILSLKVYPATHKTSLKFRELLADIVAMQERRYDEAIVLYQSVIADYGRLPGVDQTRMFEVKRRLGKLYFRRNDYDNAWKLSEEVYFHHNLVLGVEDPRSVRALSENAMYLFHKENYGRARFNMQAVVSIQQETLGKQHRDLVVSYRDLAIIKRAGGEIDTADWFRKSLKLAKRHYGWDHRQTAKSYYELGVHLFDRGQKKEAEAMMNNAVWTAFRAAGEENDQTRKYMADFASKFHRKIVLDQSAYTMVQSAKFTALANQSFMRRDYAGAEKYLLSALSVVIADDGIDKKHHWQLYIDLGKNAEQWGRFDVALGYYKKLAALHITYYGAGHRWTKNIHQKIARKYMNQNNYEAAEPWLKFGATQNTGIVSADYTLNESIDLEYEFYYANNPLGSGLDDNYIEPKKLVILARRLGFNKNFAEALVKYENAATVFEDALKRDHPALAALYFEIGMVLQNLDRHQLAAARLKSSYEIRKIAYGVESKATIDSRFFYGEALYRSGYRKNGMSIMKQAISQAEKTDSWSKWNRDYLVYSNIQEKLEKVANQ